MIERDGVCKRPKAVHRTATQVWNLAADEFPSWPRTRLTIPNYSRADCEAPTRVVERVELDAVGMFPFAVTVSCIPLHQRVE